MERQVILFDGVCNFCNGAINFTMDRDPKGKFKFAALQSDFGQQVQKQFNLHDKVDSIILLQGDRVFIKSSAALRIAKQLSGLWPMMYVLIIIPSFIRDFFYDWIARNRYKWFGKMEACRIPTPELKQRFL